MSSITVAPGEIKVVFSEDGTMNILRNMGNEMRLAIVQSKRKRNRLRIIITNFEKEEAYELNWRKVKWGGAQ